MRGWGYAPTPPHGDPVGIAPIYPPDFFSTSQGFLNRGEIGAMPNAAPFRTVGAPPHPDQSGSRRDLIHRQNPAVNTS